MSDTEALDAIQELMSGREWSNDTLGEVAEIMRRNGRVIEDVDYSTDEPV